MDGIRFTGPENPLTLPRWIAYEAVEPGGIVWDDGLAVIVKSGVAPETTIGTARNISKKETPPLKRRKRPDRLSRPPIQQAFIDLGSLLQFEDLQKPSMSTRLRCGDTDDATRRTSYHTEHYPFSPRTTILS